MSWLWLLIWYEWKINWKNVTPEMDVIHWWENLSLFWSCWNYRKTQSLKLLTELMLINYIN